MHNSTANSYDDIEIGERFVTPGITVSESHVLGFAGLTGDFMPHHVDETFAKELGFKGRLAHGLLVLSLVDGLKNRAKVQFDVLAALNWQDWRFLKPVYVGDRIHAEIEIRDKRPTRNETRGIVTLAIRVLNQDGEVVQEGENQLMLLRRPTGKTPG
ncbi:MULTISPECIES: MaoC/PaaZ C-terminal domain-containing protein [Pseudomonas]|uniref:MaoC family dehydratase n=1 Tax=Pseudomonas TaxID=286 RepID=UPI00249BA866|nr:MULTISPECIES: MaoC/PaaZ C-terminal domain-containing protein [Pseudomonas]